MASHGFIFEASSLVSIFSLVFSIHLKVSHFMLPTDVSGSHVYPAFTFAVCGCVRFSIMCVGKMYLLLVRGVSRSKTLHVTFNVTIRVGCQ